jgi:Helicase HerA, central domain
MSLIRPPRARQPSELGPYRVEAAAILHPDGSRSAVIATSDLDIDALDPARRTAAVESFARLCRALDAPLQLLIRVREPGPDLATPQPGPHAREAAMRLHWSRRLQRNPAHTSTVLVVVRCLRHHLLDELAESTRGALRATGVSAERLRDEPLAAVVAEGLRLDVPVPWREYPDHLEIGRELIRGFALRRLPGHAVSAGWLAPLIRVGAACDIAVHLAPKSLGDALSSISRSLRNFSAHRLLEMERGALADAHVEVALDSAYALRDRLARNLGRPLHMSVTACVRAEELHELRRRGEAVRVAFAASLARVEPTHFRHLSAFVTTSPLGVDRLHNGKLVESGAASTCFPWVDTAGADPRGYRIGMKQRSGIPVRIDPFDSARHTNANIAVLAASGHGKSYLLGAMVLEAADHGVDSLVIDPEGEYRAVVQALGGAFVELAPGTEAAINVLDGGLDDVDGAAGATVELAAVLCGGRLSEVERAHVDAAARAACQRAAIRCRTPLLEDCVAELDAGVPQLATVLRRFCSGALGALFNRATTVQVEAGTCAISLRDLPDEHVAAATLVVARWVWSLVLRRTAPRHIVFDEVGALCAHAPLRTLLVQLARRCRKHGASLVVATQNAQDLLGSDEGRVVATNCATLLLGGHHAAEAALMATAFGLTERQRRFLETASRGEFLLLAGDRRAEIQVDVPDLHRSILAGSR